MYIDPNVIKTSWLFDSHFPFNIDIQPLLNYLKDNPVDIFGFGGDNWSLDCISHHSEHEFKNIGYNNIAKRFQNEKVAFQDHLKRFREVLPKAKFVYLIGNHEVWLERFCIDHPQLEQPNLEGIITEALPGCEVIPQGQFYQIGKLNFCHGDNFGTANPAKQAVERCKQSVVFGHHHTFKVWPDFSMVSDLNKYVGIQVPCFTGRAPDYGRGRPNSWMNGFFKAIIKRNSGNFTPYVILVSPKGHFLSLDGKEYA